MEKYLPIIAHFALEGKVTEVKPLGDGLINDTLLVKTEGPDNYVLQRINNAIFQDVELLQHNIDCVTRHIRGKLVAAGESDIDRKVLRFLPCKETGKSYWTDGESYWRISVFIRDAFTYNVVNPEYSYYAGLGFGNFEAQLADIPDDQISDEPLSQTFFNRWRREAEMIDEEDLRQFWAKLLVEETKAPHSISPRTLHVARDLSREDAVLFERVAQCVFDDTLVVDGNGIPPNCSYLEKIRLQDAGLIGSANSRREFQVHSDGRSGKACADIVFQDDGFLIRCFGNEVHVSCHVLTTAGIELMKILSIRRTQEDIVAIAKAIADQKKHSLVEVHKVTSIEPGDSGGFGYRYEIDPVWTTKKA